MRLSVLALPLLLAACTSSAPVAPPPDHPASAQVASAQPVALLTLDPVAQPDLPPALVTAPMGTSSSHTMTMHDQPSAEAASPAMESVMAMDHANMNHADADAPPTAMKSDHVAVDHSAMNPADAAAAASSAQADPLARTLDAYLAAQEKLASDQLGGVADHARSFSSAFDALTALAPEGDPHRWHSRSDAVRTTSQAARSLAQASTLADAREAFAILGAAYLSVLEATGAPAGYDLRPMRCGMFAGAPEGGVWIQRTGPTRNPFFGSSMLTCGSDRASAIGDASPTPDASSHGDSHH